MSSRRSALVFSAIAASIALACSPSTVAVTDAADGGQATTKACVDRAYAYCTHLNTCSQTDLQTRYGDFATCQSLFQSNCENNQAAPSSGATPATAEACVAAIPQWSCDDYLRNDNVPPACLPQAGTLPIGATCAVSSQCQSTWCSFANFAACGTCATPPSAGDPCQSGVCPNALACDKSVCVAFVGEGSSCGPSAPCAADLTCVPGVGSSPALCQKGAETMGAPCTPTGAGCDPDLGFVCNLASGMCATAVIAKAGEACGTVANQSALCFQGQCVRGTCQAYLLIGQACDINSATSCTDGTRCVVTVDGGTNGTCQASGFTACR